MNREQRQAMQLAGTVSVPQKFPQLAMISFVMSVTEAGEAEVSLEYLVVDHVINAKLRIRRSFRASDVSAVFLPHNNDGVDLQNGEWFLGGEIADSLPAALGNRGGTARGIAYVPELAATLMQVEVGMTAAESVDYYPPLPDDRSVDHYAMAGPGKKGGSAGGVAAFCEPGEPCSAAFSGCGPGEPCSASFGEKCGDEPRKPKKEKNGKKKKKGKKQEKARGKKQKRGKKEKKSEKRLVALDPRSRIIW